MLVNNVLGKIQ